MYRKKSNKDSLEYAENILNTIREPLIVLDQNLRVISANSSFFKVFREEPDETLGQLIYNLGNHQWDIPQLRELLERILPLEQSFDNYKVEHHFNTLGRRIMSLNARKIERKKGKEEIILLAIEDITEKEMAQLALEDSEERFRRLFETAKDGLFLLDKKNGQIVNANPAICKLLGYTQKKIIGKSLHDFHFSMVLDDFYILLEHLIIHGFISYNDIFVQNKLGTPVSIDLQIIDRSRFIQCNFRDITARKIADKEKAILTDQLNQAQRMKTVGVLAGGIAHDFNNILSIIIGNAELALNDISPENPVKENMETVLAASIRAKDLVSQILTFSRKDKAMLIPLWPQPLINETLKLLRSATPATISIIQNISKDCGMIMTDITQFHQIIMNLFGNAVQSMNEKGEVIVSLQEVNLNNKDFSHFSKMSPLTIKAPGAFARFSVADSGNGIGPHIMKHIFEPFFTTKKVGEGTGMGLSVVHGIIQSQEGFITVESEEDKGSTFSVFLPITHNEETHHVEVKKTILTGTERILLVDDEELLLNMTEQLLEQMGYTVTSEERSIKALKIFKTNPENFDLVITDQSMPEMSGGELASQILKVRPEMPIILCSGYSSKVSEENYRDTGIAMYLNKPYNRKALSGTVRKVLDGKGSK